MNGADVVREAIDWMGPEPRDIARAIAVILRRESIDAGRSVRWQWLGTFLARSRKARRVRNPATKRLMRLPKTLSVGLRPSKYARKAVRR